MSEYVRQEKSQKKHPIVSSSAPKTHSFPTAPMHRPGWKGPGYIQKAPKQPTRSSKSPSASEIQEQHLPLELQQQILNVFRNTFAISQDYESLKPVLQDIKHALFERDFERAFGREDWLEAYAVRWSPSRALCYSAVLIGLCEEFGDESWFQRLLRRQENAEEDQSLRGPTLAPRAICFGGGAAELMAFGGILRHLRQDANGLPLGGEVMETETLEQSDLHSLMAESRKRPILDLHLVDTADWGSVVLSLQMGLMTPPELSKYASATAKAKSAPLIAPWALTHSFTQADVLDLSEEAISTMIGSEPVLVTLLFTLNELYTSSISKTTGFLVKLTLAAPRDSLFLVIDSPGSYSETAVGKEETGTEKKRYPMHWLMDHVLIEKGVKGRAEAEVAVEPKWKKLVDDESRWFRLKEGLKYPVGLENMRFQLHLFRRL